MKMIDIATIKQEEYSKHTKPMLSQLAPKKIEKHYTKTFKVHRNKRKEENLSKDWSNEGNNKFTNDLTIMTSNKMNNDDINKACI